MGVGGRQVGTYYTSGLGRGMKKRRYEIQQQGTDGRTYRKSYKRPRLLLPSFAARAACVVDLANLSGHSLVGIPLPAAPFDSSFLTVEDPPRGHYKAELG